MSWSPQQEAAIKAVRTWLADKRGPQVFRLFGYAGTGKTTLAKEIAAAVSGTVLFACFTGKASLVLRKKGCGEASTIHSLIYKVEEDADTGKVTFRLNHDSPLAYSKLLVVDEVSMVDVDLAMDLLSFGVRILVLGDPAQLPPVKGAGYFIDAAPDFMLTEVHRQARDSPIIRMSMDVREGRPLQCGQFGDTRVVRRRDIDKDELQQVVLQADQILCGKNSTRQTFNTRVRSLLGMAGSGDPAMPVPGDRLVCLRNNKEKQLLNGGLWSVHSTSTLDRLIKMEVRSLDMPDQIPQDVVTAPEFFHGTEANLNWKLRKLLDEFTYGYALTVHKSQGSQWDSVALFDESSVFRDDRAKHLYTGITRAAERITVVL